MVEVAATTMADSTKRAKALLSLIPLVAISVYPQAVSLRAGQQKQFTSSVTGTANTNVVWSIDPPVGAISSTGLYTAPASVFVNQTVTIKATSAADPTKTSTTAVTLIQQSALSFRRGLNGLDSLEWNGKEFNYKYGEGMLTHAYYGPANTDAYSPACIRALNADVLTHRCAIGPLNVTVTATHYSTTSDSVTADITVTNEASSTETINSFELSVLGISTTQYDEANSRTGGIDIENNPVAIEHFGDARFFLWLDTPSPDASIWTRCSGSGPYVCKNVPRVKSALAPGQSRTIRITGRFTSDLTSNRQQIAPQAYESIANALPAVVNWPDRRPINAWFIGELSARSATNPRGYFQRSDLDVSNATQFRKVALDNAIWIRDKMNARPIRPQGIIVWDIEGQEFIHATTYIGDPKAFESGYAPEMNAVADDIFKTFRDAGYRVGVTIRPTYLLWGTELPTTCTYSAVNRELTSYFVKVNEPLGSKFYSCNPDGASWSLYPKGSGTQTGYKYGQFDEVTDLLRQKMRYAHDRWGATLFYLDSAVWPSDNRTLDSSIIRTLQKEFPDSLIIPEQETLTTLGAGIPWTDPRNAGDPKYAPVNWRWAYPAGAMMINIGDCAGTCWSTNVESFRIGQRIGDIAFYAQPTQVLPSHLANIEAEIAAAREASSRVFVTDSVSGARYTFSGNTLGIKPYPVKLRVYFAGSTDVLGVSKVFCEAGQWQGENSCQLDLSGANVAEVRYYDFADTLVGRDPAVQLK